MAVFTPISEDEARAFLARYELPRLARLDPILAGVENTNYRVELEDGQRFALTLFERHRDGAALPFLLGFAAHLAAQGFAAAGAIGDRSGCLFSPLKDKPAALVRWVKGEGPIEPTLNQAAEAGEALARMHGLASGFAPVRANPFGPARWRALLARCAEAPPGPYSAMLDALNRECDALWRQWPQGLPAGAIHGDYFPDNVLFEAGALAGVIDFGFACTDGFAYDLAIALNAWGFDQAGEARLHLLAAFARRYREVRAPTHDEHANLPILLRGAALRFCASRLHDQLYHDRVWQVTPKDPAAFFRRLAFFQDARNTAAMLEN